MDLHTHTGIVYLVGAGPGDPSLLTRRGADLLSRCDVVVYDGLVGAGILDLVPAECERVYAGKKGSHGRTPMSQDRINQMVIEYASAGRAVVRLKGGDPYVFGRGAEECTALAAAGIPFEVIPGVSSGTAVPAYAGIPLTARGVASTAVFVTGQEMPGKPDCDVDWASVARMGTVVLFMALRTLEACVTELIAHGRRRDEPAAAIYWGTTAGQQVIQAPLADLPSAVLEAGLRPPVITVVGDVVGFRDNLNWYEHRPLFGRRILITRPFESDRRVVSEIRGLGGEAIVMPLTRFASLANTSNASDAVQGLALGEYTAVAFASANAVRFTFDAIAAGGFDARVFAGCKVVCVGASTAQALLARGIRADAVPHRSDAAGLANSLSELEGGGAVLFPRAEEGIDTALVAVRAAGREAHAVSMYRTERTPHDDPARTFGMAQLRVGRVDAVAVFAPSQARALAEALGKECASLLSRCEVAAIGQTTAGALEEAGIAVDIVASHPSTFVSDIQHSLCGKK